MKKFRKISIVITAVLAALAGAVVLFGIWCNHAVGTCRQYCYSDAGTLPEAETALLLGVARMTPSGVPNLYYRSRVETAAKLFHSGKITHILISGDNSRKDYDEPTDMKNDLRQLGVPETAMTLDYAGFRTLDSVLRAKRVFNKNKFVIITQPGHAERAVYIARKHDIGAVAFLAPEPEIKWLVARNRKREKYACIAAWLDVNILRRSPKY